MRFLFLLLILTFGWAGPGTAQTAEDRILAALHDQGYEILQKQRTLLGRMWLLAENDEVRREIVFNPGTGEILRDYSVLLASIELWQPKTDRGTGSDSAAAIATTTGNGEGTADSSTLTPDAYDPFATFVTDPIPPSRAE